MYRLCIYGLMHLCFYVFQILIPAIELEIKNFENVSPRNFFETKGDVAPFINVSEATVRHTSFLRKQTIRGS